MHLKLFRVKNYRRLKDVRVDLHSQTSIFVGANNSGKTSATHVFQSFLGETKGVFSVYDFSSDCWKVFDSIDLACEDPNEELPRISLDLWFEVDDLNLHRVIDLIPSLDWDSTPVGMRLDYRPIDGAALLANYAEARERAEVDHAQDNSYNPWPRNLTDYLRKRIGSEYEVHYSILDATQFDEQYQELPSCEPFPLGNATSGAAKRIESMIRVDFLDAQRHLSDGESRGRHEDLSKRLSRYYARNLRKHEDDLAALSAISNSEVRLNQHFAEVFQPVLGSLRELGYPGVGNHELVVKADFNAATILNGNAHVHYALPSGKAATADGPTLPDRYNGLGFKNLIYMAVELLDFHHAWADVESERPPVHLVIIEEPESHLHAQLQQVFIRKIAEILPATGPEFQMQMVITTHSSHMIYESTFNNIRYFRRAIDSGLSHTSDVRNLSTFYSIEEEETREFLLQYLKLTHCDLFFADAALLVEGNVERLLLPLMIERDFPALRANHLTILEVGGAFAHKFDKLIEFLDIPALVITDLDSVVAVKPPGDDASADSETHDDDDSEDSTKKTKCMVDTPDAVTSNETLKQWIPRMTTIVELVQAVDADKFAVDASGDRRRVRVAYQIEQSASWGDEVGIAVGRTLEEAFALENLEWCQKIERKSLGLRIRGSEKLGLAELRCKVYEKVVSFDKTKFALGLIADRDNGWATPGYIAEGLKWLQDILLPAPETLNELPAIEKVEP